jgi:hypothetical protein
MSSNKQPNVPSSSDMNSDNGQMKVDMTVCKAWKTAGASCGQMKKPTRSTKARKRIGVTSIPGTVEHHTGQFLCLTNVKW